MKIIDEWKILSKIFKLKDKSDKEIDILMNKWFKDDYSKEYIFTISSKRFKIKNKILFQNEDYIKNIIKKRNQFLKNKYEQINPKLKKITISKEDNIKNKFGYIADKISEINSSDPRLLVLWHYNSEINMNIKINNKFKINFSNYEKFSNEFSNFNISNKNQWKLFLSLFQINDSSGEDVIIENIKDFGEIKFKKIMKDLTKENIKKYLKLKDEDLEKRIHLLNIKKIIEEING